MVYDEIPISHPVSSMEVDKEYIYLMGGDQVGDPLVQLMDFSFRSKFPIVFPIVTMQQEDIV